MRRRILFVLAILTLILSVGHVQAPVANAQDTPQRGGTLRVAAESMSNSLDIGFWQGFGALHVIDSIGEGLVRADFQTGKVLPGLAESWTLSSDGLTYVFKIRKGMVFHDGAPITAQAIVRSMTRSQLTKDPSYIEGMYMYGNQGMDNWQSLEAKDDLTVELKLKTPNATQLLVFTRPDGYIISPKAMDTYGKDIGLHMSMAGPFKIERFTPGQEAVLDANPDYWGGKPYLDKIIIRAYPDEASILAALQAGEVDLTLYAPFDSVPRIQKDTSGSLKIAVGAPLVVLMLGINTSVKPLDNVKVRQAINYAVDRDAIIQAGLAGMGQAPASILAPNDLGFDPAGKEISHLDAAKAKQLLAESGISLPIPLSISFENNRFWPILAELIASNLNDVGFKVTLDRLDIGSFNGKTSAGKTQLALVQRSTFLPDPNDKVFMVNSKLSPGGISFLETLPTAKQLDGLIDTATATLDPAKRAELYKQIQALALEQMPYVYLAYLTPPIFLRANVQNVDTQGTAAGRVDFRGIWLKQ
jgi:peptide/nickel transport system substrate-binding protein